MSERSLEIIRDIRQRLHRAARRIAVSDVLFGIVLTIAAGSAIWLLIAALESALWMELPWRRAAFAGWLLGTTSVAAFFLLPATLRLIRLADRGTEEETALRIGDRFPEVSDRLLNLLQLGSGRSAGAPSGLIDGAIAMLQRQIAPVRFEDVEDFSRPRRAAVRAAVAPAALLFFAALAPEPFMDASGRLLALNSEFEPPAPFAINVTPGDVELTRGEPLDIAAYAEGSALPAEATIQLQAEGVEEPELFPMVSTSAGRFEHRIGRVRHTARYRVEAGGVTSPWFDIRVLERPFVRGIQLRVEFPSYTALPPQSLVPDRGDVTALRGSRVRVSTRVGGMYIDRVFVEFDDGELVPMELSADSATASFTVDRDATYRIVAESSGGVRNADPVEYRIEPVSDQPPAIRLVTPEADVTLNETLETFLGGAVIDDFGFSQLELRYRLAESRYRPAQESFERLSLPLETPRPVDQEVSYLWQIKKTGLDPVPGDVIEYYLEVWDNDQISGPKSARSTIQRVRIPSLSERYEELDVQQNDTQDEMQRLLEEAGEIRRDFDEIRDEMRSKQGADWQDRRQIEALQQRQESMEQRVDELSRRMEDVTRQMEENNLLSEETVEMYRELTRVVEEIKSPELMEALRQLQEAIEQLDMQQMQESMQDFQFNEQQYRERLERSLELFKRTRALQHLEQAERMAQELAQRQQELRDAAEKATKDDPASSDEDLNDSEESDEAAGQEESQTPNSEAQQPESTQESDSPQDPDSPQQSESPQQQGDSSENESDEQQGQESAPDEQAPDREKVAQEQERMGEDMEKLEQKLDEVREQLNQSRGAPTQQMDQLREELRRKELPEKMRETGQQIRSNQMQDAGRSQQNMQQQLEQLQQQLGEMRSGMSGAQLNMNMSALRRTIRDIISLSKEQEGLQNSTVEKGPGSPALREMARTQVRLAEGVGVVADSIQGLAKEIPQMSREAQRHTGEALREMGRATEALAERASREAGTHQRSGMTHLNELALMLSDLLDQLMSQQSGSGGGGMSAEEMADQLQQMSQEQQRLNQQIQQMLNDMHGDRLSTDMQERLRQLAAQQDAIRRQLRQLSRDPLARDELMNDLGRIAEQMQETIDELQQRGASRETIERQQQILTRMLEAERSLQERQQDEQRRGRTGDDVTRESPPELQRSQELEKLRRDLLRALESDYSQDYQDLIRRYFELLRREIEPAE